ncbi:extracellular solute-binding protein [Natronosalvus amylolyticus]|uniref:extracellular solute-binding protein n=1 Tax=Natronosalvus amylolyticus TaxID=2961994 RepID=UPI0020C9B43D|nr:extracellular solute-binding protein [Natronosalvus amylolyticus]
MVANHSQGSDTNSSSVSRRTFVKAAGASGAAVGLAGCIYGDDGDGDEVVISMGAQTIEDVEGAMPDLLRENGLDDDISLRFSSQSDDSGDQRDTYMQLLESGEAEPDLMMVDTGWTNVLIERGHLANLSEELDDDTLDLIDSDYFDAFTETARDPDGDLFALPLFPDYAVMFYNKDYARDAGYDDSDFDDWSTNPMTWSEWAEVTEEIVEASDAEFGLATQWDIYEGTACCTWNEVMTSWGGAYFGGIDNLAGPVGDRPVTVDEEEFIEGLRMMYTFAASEEDENTHPDYPTGIASDSITSWTEEGAREPFSSGDAAMLRNWPYTVPLTLDPDNEEYPFESADDLGAMPIPYAVEEGEGAYPGTGGTTSAQGGWHIALNPNSERKEEALEVMRAMTEDDFNLGMLDVIAWLPPKPALFDADEATDPDAVGEIANYMDTLRVAGEGAMPRPVTEQWPSQVDIIAEQVNQSVAGDKSPEDAAADLQTALEDSESV